MDIATRQAYESDYQWLFELKVASMHDYIDQIYGWNDAVQKEFFDSCFNPSDLTVITVDGIVAGMFELAKEKDGYFLRRIEIHPTFHNKGIGSYIIQEIISQAASEGENVNLRVFKINPAQNLYKRLGFELVKETATHYKMAYHHKTRHQNNGGLAQRNPPNRLNSDSKFAEINTDAKLI